MCSLDRNSLFPCDDTWGTGTVEEGGTPPVIYTRPGYYFFGNGTGSNFLITKSINSPRKVAVGILAPLTVPCPTHWTDRKLPFPKNLRRQKRGVTQEYCSEWDSPTALGGKGDVFGWGLAGFFTLGGSAGAMAAKNKNYLVCGLSILGNKTKRAIEIIRESLTDLRMFTQQNRYALDYILAREGGVCKIIQGKCMMGVNDRSEDLEQLENELSEWLEGMSGPGEGWGFGGWYDWIIDMLIYLAIIVCCVFLGIAILKCILSRMMTSVSTLGQSVDKLGSTQRMLMLRMDRPYLPLSQDDPGDQEYDDNCLDHTGTNEENLTKDQQRIREQKNEDAVQMELNFEEYQRLNLILKNNEYDPLELHRPPRTRGLKQPHQTNKEIKRTI